ncbi:hypothetical protein BGZ58_004648 [Dissophora ornata]|nr:hypothetical protein BGZ58_004648 [Dissophora ornata]
MNNGTSKPEMMPAMDLIPIQFSHTVIMMCIEEIKLRGRFFFELLGLLPELNRYLFVEILDLCCALVDQQAHNQISHSKLAVFPGSCCFGLNEYKPNWDARYLMSADLKRFSSAFYHAIYAYREERDLTGEQLQEKLDTRARILEQERIAALEREHGYRGAQTILRMEARIAQGLPAESPNAMKEISLYADRKERVVADDAISVLDIQLDDDEDGVSKVPDLNCIAEEEEEQVENVQAVIRDLRRSVSVASLGKSLYENQPRPQPPSPATSSPSPTVATPTTSMRNGYLSPATPASPTSPLSPKSIFSGPGLLSRSSTIARSVSLKLHPVSPGDIFGISQRAVEKRELEGFLAVARTVRKKKSSFSKRTLQQRQMHKMRVLAAQDSSHMSSLSLSSMAAISTKSIRTARRNRNHASQTSSPLSANAVSRPSLPTAAALRRERSRKFRMELEVYQAKGLSFKEATEAREADLKKQKRRERRAKQAALAKAEAEKEAAAAAAVADAIAQRGLTHSAGEEMTMEEAEILEAFDYLSDEEFQEFLEMAGLTAEDIEVIRAKAVALSLSKVTQDIQNVAIEIVSAPVPAISEPKSVNRKRDSIIFVRANSPNAQSHADEPVQPFPDGEDFAEASSSTNGNASARDTRASNNRPFNIPHMTSMDLMFKHASVVGDANLRLYPTRPSSPTVSDYESDSMHGGLLSRAASVMRSRNRYEDDEDNCEDGEMADGDDEDSFEAPLDHHPIAPAPVIPYAARPAPVAKTMSFESASDSRIGQGAVGFQERYQRADQILPQQQINNYQPYPRQSVVKTIMDFEEEVVVMSDDKDEEDNEEETEEEAELRELLESMSEEERTEFLRLSNQEDISRTTMAPGLLVHH